MFGWDPKLPTRLHTDSSKFVCGAYISQLQKNENSQWEDRPLYYDSFTLNTAERAYGAYKRELRAIVGFATKYRHLFDGPETSTIYTDHKPLAGFLNSDTHEDIYARWATKLRMLNIKLVWIKGKRNAAADRLSCTIFQSETCEPDEIIRKLSEEVRDQDGNPEWFWKSGKGGYEEKLKTLNKQSYRLSNVGLVQQETPGGWVTFSMAGRVGGQATTPLNKLQLSPWYQEVYQYYRLQEIPFGLDQLKRETFKRRMESFRWDESNNQILH